MMIFDNRRFRVTCHFVPSGKIWGLDNIQTHWGCILSVSVWRLWFLINIFRDYEAAFGK